MEQELIAHQQPRFDAARWVCLQRDCHAKCVIASGGNGGALRLRVAVLPTTCNPTTTSNNRRGGVNRVVQSACVSSTASPRRRRSGGRTDA